MEQTPHAAVPQSARQVGGLYAQLFRPPIMAQVRPRKLIKAIFLKSAVTHFSFYCRETVCCGTIFRGPMNAIVIDMNLFRPCVSRRSSSLATSPSSLTTASPPPATSPPSSQSPDSTSSASSHFKLDGSSGASTGEGSETGDGLLEQTSFDRAFENKQNGHCKMAVPAAL